MAVLAAVLFFVCRIVYAGIINLPYPKELLEPSNIALTNTFLAGKSPYTLSSLEWEVPPVNYDYPFLNSLIAAAIVKITGCGSVTAHFIISLYSIIASGILGAAIIKDHSKTPIAPALAAVLFMFCHWRFGYISAAPDDFGLFISLFTMYIAINREIAYKPFWCAIGITLSLYTKQYFICIAMGIFIYMFFYSHREAMKLAVITVAINAIIAAVITELWPLYWTRAFLFTYLGTVVGGGAALSTLVEQFRYLIIAFATLFIIIVVAAIMGLKKLKQNNEKTSSIRIRENDPLSLFAINSIVMLLPLYFLGRNDGAFLSYFLQLWLPSISITALICLERMKPERSKPDGLELVYTGIYAIIAFSIIYFGFGKLPLHILTEEEIANWEKSYAYVDEYRKEGDVFYSRGLAYKAFSDSSVDCIYGHDGEVSEETVETLINKGVPVKEFPNIQTIVDQNLKYRQNQLERARNHKYSLITSESEDYFNPFYCDLPELYSYTILDRFNLQFGNMPYEVVFYTR